MTLSSRHSWRRLAVASLILAVIFALLLLAEALVRERVAANSAYHSELQLQSFIATLPGVDELALSQPPPTLFADCGSAPATGLSVYRWQAQGYLAPIELALAVVDGVALRLAILTHQETPGFVERLDAAWLHSSLQAVVDNRAADALSGATISSQAILDAVSACWQQFSSQSSD